MHGAWLARGLRSHFTLPRRGIKTIKGYKMNKIRIVQSDGSSYFIESPMPVKLIQEDTPLHMKPAWKFRQRRSSTGLSNYEDLFGGRK